jgi:phosphate transport system permease protein
VLNSGRTILTAALVLAVMVVPIITAICREIFLQTPRLHEEAALALGATRGDDPHGGAPVRRSGIVSASMLGLGRALGETMAVAMVLSATNVVTLNLLTSQNPSTIAANIALTFPRRTPQHQRPHRDGPDPVRRHLRRQRRGPLDRQPPQGILGSELT